MRRLTQEQFEERLSERCPGAEPLEPYTRMSDKIRFRCRECGNEWEARPANLMSGTGCPACGRERTTKARRKTHEEFVAELAEINEGVEVLGHYKNGNARIAVKCRTCGNEWAPRAQSLLKGYGCWECGKKKIGDALRKSHEGFIQQMEEINPYVEILGDYKGDNVKIEVRCRRCGNEWKITPGGLVAGHGCTECGKSSTSFSEQFILQGLRVALGEDAVLHRDSSAIGAELDIYIPSLHLAIEPGGWHWHKSKVVVGAGKRALCAQNGIRLITIYDNYKDPEPPFSEDCLVFPFKLSFEKGFWSLRETIQDVLANYSVDHPFSEADWKLVAKRARKCGSKITTEEFVEKLGKVNDRVIVKGEYVNNHTKIGCECPECGYEWSASPTHLLSGEACPSCAGTKKKTHEEFVEMIAQTNPSVEIVGQYTRASEKVHARCRNCRYEWDPTANSLQQGTACPKCAAERRAQSRRLTNEEFAESLRAAQPGVVPLEPYLNGTTPMRFRCEMCGTTWEQEPRILLYYKGYGCPVCTNRYHKVSNLVSAQPSLFDDLE